MKKIKMKKIGKYILDDIKNNTIVYIILVLVILLSSIKLNYYIFSPGGLTPLDNRIIIDNSYSEEGSFNLTYVSSRQGSLLNILVSYIIPSWDIVDADTLRVDGEDDKTATKRGQIALEETSYDAIIAAFSAADKPHTIKSIDLAVTYIYDFAETNIKVGDIIKDINGIEVSDMDSLHNEINKYSVNDKVRIKVLRDNKEKDCYGIIKEKDEKKVIGIYMTLLKRVETNPKVEYVFKNNESGSSRGLMCALEIYNKITEEDITKGRKIAGTGTIYDDGTVGSIDGIKYKIIGAAKNDVDIFIVPSDNYEEAYNLIKKRNYKMKLIKADNLKNVIEELKK